MQHLVERIYSGDLKDINRKVSRFEYEQREARNKLDIAELYAELGRMKTALEKAAIVLPEKDAVEREDVIVALVQEDNKNMEEELAESLHYHLLVASQKKGVLSKLNVWGNKRHVNATVNKSVRTLMKNQDKVDLTEEILSNIPPYTTVTPG